MAVFLSDSIVVRLSATIFDDKGILSLSLTISELPAGVSEGRSVLVVLKSELKFPLLSSSGTRPWLGNSGANTDDFFALILVVLSFRGRVG